MKILFISNLSSNIADGLNWSVPSSVNAQSKYDDVLWVNTSEAFIEHWGEVKAYHNWRDFGEFDLNGFPDPFKCPDLVVFEGFNFIRHAIFSKTLRKKQIPYIIIPRGSLTFKAQHNHSRYKKVIANILFLDSFVKNALAIQFLTKGERDNSIGYNQLQNYILPNGFDDPCVYKETFSIDSIKATFIGRLDMYHKGLDMLLNVLEKNKEVLKKSKFRLSIYGPKRYDYHKIKKIIEKKCLTEVATIVDEISGKEKERLLLNTDLFIMTSRLEGHPMGLIEALAYGVPCLISRGTNMYDEVKNSCAGWVCESEEESIEEALLKMLDETGTLPQKSAAARELASCYQWDKLARQFHDEVMQMKTIR